MSLLLKIITTEILFKKYYNTNNIMSNIVGTIMYYNKKNGIIC